MGGFIWARLPSLAKGEMVRRHLEGGDVPVGGQQRDFLSGRHMQQMHALACDPCQAQQPFGRQTRCFGIAPEGVARRIIPDLEAFPLAQARLVLGMKGGTAGDAGQNHLQILLIFEEEFACRGTQEDLDAAAAGQLLELVQRGGVFSRRPEVKGEITVHAGLRTAQLVCQGVRRCGGGPGIRHFKHGSYAAHHGGAAAGVKILLVLKAGLAEMDVGIDDAGQDMQAAAIDGERRLARRNAAEGRYPAGSNADVALADTVVIDEGAIGEHEIVEGRHG